MPGPTRNGDMLPDERELDLDFLKFHFIIVMLKSSIEVTKHLQLYLVLGLIKSDSPRLLEAGLIFISAGFGSSLTLGGESLNVSISARTVSLNSLDDVLSSILS